MVSKENNHAFIDEANLYGGLKRLGWQIDYRRLRIWLKEKYSISNTYIFLSFVPGKEDHYKRLEDAGFILIHKETPRAKDGKIKGNCDADLVLHVVNAFHEKQFQKAIIVSSDGDFAVLVKFLKERNSFYTLISPSNRCSRLLLKQNISIVYLDTQRKILEALENQTPHPEECGADEEALGKNKTSQSPST